MKARLKSVLTSKVDPVVFVIICLTLVSLGVGATAMARQVSDAYDPTLVLLARPFHFSWIQAPDP